MESINYLVEANPAQPIFFFFWGGDSAAFGIRRTLQATRMGSFFFSTVKIETRKYVFALNIYRSTFYRKSVQQQCTYSYHASRVSFIFRCNADARPPSAAQADRVADAVVVAFLDTLPLKSLKPKAKGVHLRRSAVMCPLGNAAQRIIKLENYILVERVYCCMVRTGTTYGCCRGSRVLKLLQLVRHIYNIL